MMVIGGLFNAPAGDTYYRIIQPTYMKYVAIFFNKGSKLSECRNEISINGSSMPFLLGHQKELNPFLNCDDMHQKHNIADFSKNVGKISVEANELEFFTFIREKRNKY